MLTYDLPKKKKASTLLALGLSELEAAETLVEKELYREATESAFGKLSLFLPKDAFPRLAKIKALFISASKFAKDYSGKEEIITQLTDAMLRNQTCSVTYHSFYDDRVKTFMVDPLHFFENNGGLYVLVNTTSFGNIRTLAVERIRTLETTGTTFDYPRGFDPEEYLGSAFDIFCEDPVRVKIWFSAGQARYIRERIWSRTQEITDQEDGSIILTMDTSGRWDVKRWVLSYGRDAKLLEPEDLKREVMDELAAARDGYC